MKKSVLLWLIAFLLTAATAVYQRVTGPTYPVSGKVHLGNELVNYRFDRTHGGEGDHPVEIKVEDEKICGELYWKRYKTNDDWTSVEMKRKDGVLVASLPHQPSAGKLLYKVILQKDDKVAVLPVEDGVIIIGFIGWLLALIAVYKFKNPKRWIVFASILMFIIFLIPHSLLGSELDYNKLDQNKISNEIESLH
ncbi:MAG: hypothetical protein P8X47_06490 [Ignavibacteriaceae bacterium]